MRVLIGVATYPTEPTVRPRTADWLRAQDESHAGIVALYTHDDPAIDWRDNLTAKHNTMRSDALELGADALLTVEADVIPPADAIERLCAVDADVVYGLYCSRSRMPLCFPTIDGFWGESISHRPEQWREKLRGGEIVSSEGAGFGCTLIRRSVLEAIEFARPDVGRRNNVFADDWHFALAVKAAGFRSAHHLGVLCGHEIRSGIVYWPDADAPGFCRAESAEQE